MEKTKIITFYLPQFHEIPENNKWWGEGFTEWTNTKKAKPLFKGHIQPKEPLNKNYYNLLDSKVQEWQAELAKKNGIYGFCYYHYWFNEKLLLEKPMENMLENKNIKLPFCISWANEPWARTWDGKEKEVLMTQAYGNESEWNKHLLYLLKFFKDDRYIKINNKPVFLIYRTESIPNCEEMIDYWDGILKNNGFDGIYLIETINSFQKKSTISNSQAVVEFEPMLTVRHHMPILKQGIRYFKKKIGLLDKISYEYVWKKVIEKNIDYGKKKYLGGFVSWDNTARKGKKGLVIDGSTPELFEKNFFEQYKKSLVSNNEFIFLNAWNEWAEGTYLEPDEINKYEYLNKISNIYSGE